MAVSASEIAELRNKRNNNPVYNKTGGVTGNDISKLREQREYIRNRQSENERYKHLLIKRDEEYRKILNSRDDYSDSAKRDVDFEEYVSKGANLENEQGKRILGIFRGNPKINNKVEWAFENKDALWMAALSGQRIDKDKEGDPILTKMTDDERATYNYLLGKDGAEKADEYIDSIYNDLEIRNTDDWGKAIKDVSSKNKAAGVVFNVGSSLFTPAAAVETLKQKGENIITGKNEPVDPYAPGMAPVRMEQASREGITQDMNSLGKFLTDTGLSVAQYVSKLPFGQGIALGIMSSGAAGQTAYDVSERGGTTDQALIAGTIAGVTEAVIEKIGIDRLIGFKNMPISGGKQLAQEVLTGIASEGIEEGTTEIINMVADNLIMGDLSNFQVMKNDLIAQGYTEGEAKKKVIKEMAKQIGLASASGALSGGVMSGGAFGLNAGITSNRGRNIDANSIDNYISAGKNMDVSSDPYKIALELETQRLNNKRLSNYQKGSLARSIDYATNRNIAQEYNNTSSQTVTAENISKPDSNIEATQRKVNTMHEEITLPKQITEPIEGGVVPEINYNTSVSSQLKHSEAETVQAYDNIPLMENELESQNTKPAEKVINVEAKWNDIEGAKVKGIASVKDGNVIVNIESGGEMIKDSVENVTFDNPGVEEVYVAAAEYQTNGAKAFTSNYNGNVSLPVYQRAFNAYYDAGLVNNSIDKVQSAYGAFIPQFVRMNAYGAGINDAKEQMQDEIVVENKANTNKKAKSHNKKVGGVVPTEASKKLDIATRDGLNALGKATGLKIRVEETLAGGKANGLYQNGTLYVALDSDNPYMVVAKHELTHAIQQYSPEAYKTYKDFVIREINKNNPKAYNEMVDRLISRYSEIGQSISRTSAMDEIVADASEMFLTDTDVIQKLVEQDRNLAEKILDFFRDLIDKIQTAMAGYDAKSKAAIALNENLDIARKAEELWIEALSEINNNSGDDIKYSLKETFKEQVDRWLSGSMKPEEQFYIGQTPEILNEFGAKKLPVVMSQNVIVKITGEKHSISLDEITTLPKELENPLFIFKGSVENSFTIVTEMEDKEGNTVLVAMHLNKYQDRINVNRIASMYGKANIYNYINAQSEDGNLLYADRNRSSEWFTSRGLQLPKLVQTIITTSKDSISQKEMNYNAKSMDNSNFADGKDIRFQLKDVDYTEYNNALKENKKLKEINALLAEQFKLTQELKPNSKHIQKVAKDILKNAYSSYPEDILIENLTSIWKYNYEHPGTMETEEMIEAINGMSTMILKKSSYADKSLVNRYEDMLDDIKKTPLMISRQDRADLASEGGIVSFRKKYLNKIKIVTEKGIPVDTFYMDLSEKYPEYFSNEITHPADQLIKIADVIDFIKPIYYNPYGMSMEESVRDLTNEIISSLYYDIKEAPPTFADKKKNELEKIRIRYNQKVKELHSEYKEKYNERLDKIRKNNQEKIKEIIQKAKTESLSEEQKQAYRDQIANLKDENLQKLKAQQERFDERMRTARTRRERTIEANKYRSGIQGIAKELSSMLLKPTEKKHLPKGFRNAIREVCQVLDFETGRTWENGEPTETALRWRKLKDAYAALKDDDSTPISSMYYQNVEISLNELSSVVEGKRVNQLKVEELEQVYNILKHIKKMVTEENKMFMQNIRDTREEIAFNIMSSLGSQKAFTQANIITKYPILDKFNEMLNKGNIKPYYFFKKIGGSFEMLYTNLRNAEDDFVKDFEAGNKYAHEMEEKYGYNQWKDDKPTEFVTIKGERIFLTTEQKMYIYAAYRRKQGKPHIEKGGVVSELPEIVTEKSKDKAVIKEIKYQSDPVQFSDRDMMKLEESLTEEQKGYVHEMVEYLSKDLGKLGNEVTNRLFGMDAYTDEYYIPLTSDKSYLDTKAGVTTDARIKRMAFTKPVVQSASNPIIADDFTKIWANHLVDMSMYHSMVLPLEDFQSVWNYKYKEKTGEEISVKKAIQRAYGPKANNYIKKLIEDLNGGIKQDIGGELSNLLISKMKVDAVMGNLSVAIQQPSSIARALVVIDPKYFGKAIFDRATYEEMIEHSPQAVLKKYGYFDVNMGRSLADVVTDQHPETPMEKFKDFFKDKNVRNEVFSWLPQKMDEITWTYMWKAVKAEINDTTKLQEGSEEYWEKVNERFKEVIDRSQVMDSVFQRSELMRSTNPLARIATNFMAEPTVSYNMLYDAITEYKKKGKDAKEYVIRATGSVIAGMVLNSILKSIISAGRDDEEKTYAEKYVKYFITNLLDDPLGMIPYINSMVSIFKGYDPVRPDMQLIQNLYYAASKLDSDKYTPSQKIMQIAQAVSPLLFNVPLKNITKDIEMIWRNGGDLLEKVGVMEGLTEYEKLKVKYPSIESSTTAAKYYDELYNAKKAGDNELYQEIYKLLISNGKKPSNIEDAIKERKRRELINRQKDEEYTDQTVVEAYDAFVNSNYKSYQAAKKKLLNQGYSAEDIQWAINKLKSEKAKAEAPTAEEFIEAYKTGDRTKWKPIYDKMKAAGWSQEDLLRLVK